jgi:tetratricopeptide (TPR) repeat protein
MKVAYQLRPLSAAEDTVALLVPGRCAEEVLRLCASLRLDPLPEIHRAADGFIVKLTRSLETPVAGAIRLRTLASDLLVPAGAELVPPLLPDEAAALVRRRGLVFLPDGRVLEYQPDRPLELAELLGAGAIKRGAWRTLPEPPALAESVTEIALDLPSEGSEGLLEAGGEGIGTEPPELPDAGLPSQIAGKTLFGLGKGFAWLGNKLHAPRLASLGASLVGGAFSFAPGLSEQLLGKHEAMLRRLLRLFEDGNIEEALKHALPLGDDGSRGAVPAANPALPLHDVRYSLGNLLSGRGRAGGHLWFGSGNAVHDLEREYRKQADLAAARGDFRRAAFIYGKLLRDFRQAALVLGRGGLHRDAAMLYEQVVGDPLAAAREWEAAGEIDRALHLYLKAGDHALAGDLLRRAGEEERAVAEYQLAAAQLVQSGPRFYEAGQLLEARAGRPDLALPYYRRGWDQRPDGNPLPCVLRLANHHARAGAGEPLLALTTEADEFLAKWDIDSAATFYNALARHAELPGLGPLSADLRDRARLALARKAVQVAGDRHAAKLAVTLFPAESAWPSPLIFDADRALRRGRIETPAVRATPQDHWLMRRVRLSIVRAVHQMPASKEVFLGLEDGEVLCYEPASGKIATIAREKGAILAIGSYGLDDYLAVISGGGRQRVFLAILSRSTAFHMHDATELPVDSDAVRLCRQVEDESSDVIGVYSGRHYGMYRVPSLLPKRPWGTLNEAEDAFAVIIGPNSRIPSAYWLLGMYPGRVEWFLHVPPGAMTAALPWTPSAGDVLAHPQLQASWNSGDPLELLGLDGRGTIHLSHLRPNTTMAPTTVSGRADAPFQTFARIRGNYVAGVTRTAVHWLRGPLLNSAGPPTPIRLTHPVAAFVLPAANELLIVDADCSLTRVPIAK